MGWVADLLTVGLGAAGVDTNPTATKQQKELANRAAEEAEKKRIIDQQIALASLQVKKRNTVIMVSVGAAVAITIAIIVAVAIKNKPVITANI